MDYKNYNLQYFIDKFEKINDNQCITGKIADGGLDKPLRFDCLGHCQDSSGRYNKGEQMALLNLAKNPIAVWDGKYPGYSQATPRLRLLSLLKDLKQRSYN